tara:strand:- start:135 stop:563 length:429 start_codon:yes stop_codon:yes gene_type:complete
MTVIALVGGTKKHQSDVVSGFRECMPGRVELFSASGLVDVDSRIERYGFLFSRKFNADRFTVILGVCDPKEVVELRRLGVVFCHVRGPLASVFSTVPILISDMHVAPRSWRSFKPKNVFSPEEVLSECLIKSRSFGGLNESN